MPSKKVIPQNIQLITKPPKNRFCSVFAFFSGLSIGCLTILVVVYGYWIPNACTEPVNGNWANWGSWEDCIKSCITNDQFETRFRTCTNPFPAGTGSDCIGEKAEYRTCSGADICAGGKGWTSWTEWSACSSDCDIGNATRTRECTVSVPQEGETCKRIDTDDSICQNNCASTTVSNDGTTTDNMTKSNEVSRIQNDGAEYNVVTTSSVQDTSTSTVGIWTDWESWSNCSVSCGLGNQTRQRICKDIKNTCDGPSSEDKNCDTEITCTIVHCPEGYIPTSGYCFKHHTHTVPWTTALELCDLESARLVAINDDLKRNAVREYINGLQTGIPEFFWMNGIDQQNNGTYTTDKGEILTLNYWMEGEPSNLVDIEGCILVVTNEQYKWKANNCAETASVLCESDALTD